MDGRGDIGVDGLVDVFGRASPDRADRATKAGVVDEDVHLDLLTQRSDGVAVADVKRMGNAAGVGGQGLQPFEPLGGGVHHDTFGP
jgi:hypothetical protein